MAAPRRKRRWITIDTSRVALALARARIMGARYPYYLLADSREGQLKEAEITRKPPSEAPTFRRIRQGFVYERVLHITLKSIANNAEIDASIAAKADYEYLYDRPYEDRKKVRVAGPFSVESLSPHRVLAVDENDELIDPLQAPDDGPGGAGTDFVGLILENLKTAGVQQAHKEDKINCVSITPWPGHYVCGFHGYLPLMLK